MLSSSICMMDAPLRTHDSKLDSEIRVLYFLSLKDNLYFVSILHFLNHNDSGYFVSINCLFSLNTKHMAG